MDEFEDIFKSLSLIKTFAKNKNPESKCFFYKSSIYVVDKNMSLRISDQRFFFTRPVLVPISGDYSLSEQAESEMDKLIDIDNLAKIYCENLFFIDRDAILNIADSYYETTTLTNKSKVKFVVENKTVKIVFSQGGKKSLQSIETTLENVLILPNPLHRITDFQIAVKGVIFYQAIKSDLLDRIIKIETDSEMGIVRISGKKRFPARFIIPILQKQS